MKKILFISVVIIFATLQPVLGQISWNQLPLTGAEAKIMPASRQSRFSVCMTGAFPLGTVAGRNIQLSALQNAAYAPETAARLFEQLGGQFILNDPSNPQQQTIEMDGQIDFLPGIQLGLRLGRRFEMRATAQHFRSAWSGEFPVTILPHQQEQPVPPKTLQGNAHASASGYLFNLECAFFVTRGAVRPYVSGGVRGQFTVHTGSGAAIAGIPLHVDAGPAETSFSPCGGAGIRWHCWKNAFLDAGCSFGKLSDGDYHPAAEASVGWAF